MPDISGVSGWKPACSASACTVSGLSPEKKRLMELCRGGALSVAEIAAHLSLPISVTKVLLSDLVDSGHIATHAAVSHTARPDVKLLKDVLDGLRARL